MKLSYCISCEKIKSYTIPADIKTKEGTMMKGDVCAECASSSLIVIKAFKKMNDEEKSKVIDYILNKLKFK